MHPRHALPPKPPPAAWLWGFHRRSPNAQPRAPGFGWVAVSFCALTPSAEGRPMERSKVTLRRWDLLTYGDAVRRRRGRSIGDLLLQGDRS